CGQAAELVDTTGKSYAECLKGAIDGGKIDLLIYDIEPTNGCPGKHGGTKAHWATLFGYRVQGQGQGAGLFLAVHGWGDFYEWAGAEVAECVQQMQVHPGWVLHAPVTRDECPPGYGKGDKPPGKPQYKKLPSVVIPDPPDEMVEKEVPGTDYNKWR